MEKETAGWRSEYDPSRTARARVRALVTQSPNGPTRKHRDLQRSAIACGVVGRCNQLSLRPRRSLSVLTRSVLDQVVSGSRRASRCQIGPRDYRNPAFLTSLPDFGDDGARAEIPGQVLTVVERYGDVTASEYCLKASKTTATPRFALPSKASMPRPAKLPVSSSLRPKFPPKQDAMFRETLSLLNRCRVPYVVSGAFALQIHTGIWRCTKDLDLFLTPEDMPAAMRCLKKNGFRCEVMDPVWLHKAHRDGFFVDLITGMSNAVITVDGPG